MEGTRAAMEVCGDSVATYGVFRRRSPRAFSAPGAPLCRRYGTFSHGFYTHPSWTLRAETLLLILLTILTIFSQPSTSQLRQNGAYDSEWSDSEDDQQCEMVVKCKPVKTPSSRKASASSTPETSTYRVPLKRYGAPFDPMAEGGSLMWQKVASTPRSTTTTVEGGGGGAEKNKKMPTTAEDKFSNEAVEGGKRTQSFFKRKKAQRGSHSVKNDISSLTGAGAIQSNDPTRPHTGPTRNNPHILLSQTNSQQRAFPAPSHQNVAKVAFSVSLKDYFGHPNSQDLKPIPFDVVHANMGDAFDVDKKAFIAPLEGIYFFSLTITTRRGYEAAVDLVHNYRHVWTIVIDSDQDFYSTSWSPGTNTVILHCKKGDRVFARLHGGRFSNLEGSKRNTFTGFLL